MHFFSRMHQPQFVMVRGSRRVVDGIPEETPPVLIEFSALSEPMHIRGFPFPARGQLDTRRMAEILRRRGQASFDSKDRDVTQTKIDRFLMSHPQRGRSFVLVDAKGEASDADQNIVPYGVAGFLCLICDQQLDDARAVKLHVDSSGHRREVGEKAQTPEQAAKAREKSLANAVAGAV
ncbi:MAG: hypothetical protein ACE5NA_00090 [Nitrospiraceae bacterium]